MTTKSKQLTQDQEQIRKLEGLLQGKDRIIEEQNEEIKSLTNQVSDLIRDLKFEKNRNDLDCKIHEKRIEKIADKENIVYNRTQWGNNIFYAPNAKLINFICESQWGSNIQIKHFSLFNTDPDKIAEKIAQKIVKAFVKDGASLNRAEDHQWTFRKVEISDDRKRARGK